MELATQNPEPHVDPMEGWDLVQLNNRRDELIAKSKAEGELNDDDLKELVRISHVMRRRSAGPPKEPKEKKARGTVKKAATLDELL